jgi:hypothetical protein
MLIRIDMGKEKSKWDDIPSLEGLEVDWEYVPENPLGKRIWMRMADHDLLAVLGVKRIPIKIVAKNFEETGYVLDLSQAGLAVLLNAQLAVGQAVKLGFILGQHKVISKAVVRNVRNLEGKLRIGLEFVELAKESETFVTGLISAKVFQQPLG